MRGIPEVVTRVRTRLESSWATAIAADVTGSAGPDCSTAPADPATLTVPSRALIDGTGTGSAGGSAAAWVHRFPLGKPAAGELQRDFATYVRQLPQWRTWAAEHHVDLVYGTRVVYGSRQQVITHVDVPDLETAAQVVGGPWPALLPTARARALELHRRFPAQPSLARSLRGAARLSEVDFDILCRVCDWFLHRLITTASPDTSAPEVPAPPSLGAGSGPGNVESELVPMTPRQVPIEGVHAKWLDSHQGLVRTVTGIDDLGLLPPHPARFHYTYLDPTHLRRPGRRHDSYSVGDTLELPYVPSVVLISENKDTAIGFPAVPGGIAVEGEGRGAGAISSAPWVRSTPSIIYWGDMDIDGLEILNEFRAAGLHVESILMDADTYRHYERYGTNLDRHGKSLSARAAREVPYLNADERELYDLLTSGRAPTLRIEQERIPLAVAHRHLSHVLNTRVQLSAEHPRARTPARSADRYEALRGPQLRPADG